MKYAGIYIILKILIPITYKPHRGLYVLRRDINILIQRLIKYKRRFFVWLLFSKSYDFEKNTKNFGVLPRERKDLFHFFCCG